MPINNAMIVVLKLTENKPNDPYVMTISTGAGYGNRLSNTGKCSALNLWSG